jgi:REP element-mobilizing transposase RayT
MSHIYKFHNPEGAYFVSFAVVEWIDVFTRNEYKEILIGSLSYSQENKGMEIYAWCMMTNHVHLVFKSVGEYTPENLFGDLKRFTSREIIKAIIDNPKESRKEWLLEQFKKPADHCSNVNNYQFW